MMILIAFLLASVAFAQPQNITLVKELPGGVLVLGTVGTPTESPSAGTYVAAQTVTFSSTNADRIIYTTDGSTPTCSGAGTLYTGPVTTGGAGTSVTYKVIGCPPANWSQSAVSTFAYTINAPPALTLTGKTCWAQPGNATNPVTCTWSSAPSVGERIFCGAANFNSTTGFTFSDAGNTYSPNGSLWDDSPWDNGANADIRAQMAYVGTVTQSPTTTSVTITGTPFWGYLACVSATGGTGSADGAVGQDHSVWTTSLNVPVTPTVTGDVAFCVSNTAGTAPTPPGGWSTLGGFVSYGSLTASGSQNIALGLSPGSWMEAACATYK